MAAHIMPPRTSGGTRQNRSFFARWREKFRAEWKAFADARVGTRFQERYKRQCNADRPAWKKIVSPVVGIIIVVLGLCLLPAPGPGIPWAGIGRRTFSLCCQIP